MKTQSNPQMHQISGNTRSKSHSASAPSIPYFRVGILLVLGGASILLASCGNDAAKGESEAEGKYEKIGKAVDKIEKVLGPFESSDKESGK